MFRFLWFFVYMCLLGSCVYLLVCSFLCFSFVANSLCFVCICSFKVWVSWVIRMPFPIDWFHISDLCLPETWCIFFHTIYIHSWYFRWIFIDGHYLWNTEVYWFKLTGNHSSIWISHLFQKHLRQFFYLLFPICILFVILHAFLHNHWVNIFYFIFILYCFSWLMSFFMWCLTSFLWCGSNDILYLVHMIFF